MSTSADDLLQQAEQSAKSDPKRAEQIYSDILGMSSKTRCANLAHFQTDKPIDKEATTTETAGTLRHQETALIKLGELYRDQQYVWMQLRDR